MMTKGWEIFYHDEKVVFPLYLITKEIAEKAGIDMLELFRKRNEFLPYLAAPFNESDDYYIEE